MSQFEIFIAGHGGQGVLELGNLFAYKAMADGKRVAYTPSYGPETRGGKVKCFVLFDDKPVDSPISEEPDLMVVMNEPSMDFVELLKPGGCLLRNSSLANRECDRNDITVLNLPITELAASLNAPEFSELKGNLRDATVVQNAVAFGAALELIGDSSDNGSVGESLSVAFKSKPNAIPINRHALNLGATEAKKILN